jgi:quercetin dioxygenase-like cupin family protein
MLFALALLVVMTATSWAQDVPQRKELRRVDLSGAPGMEVILSYLEFKPGDVLPLHFHHGIETGYFLEGGTIETPWDPTFVIPTGAPMMNLRGVPHDLKVVGDKTIKLISVHIVDKGKPLYDMVKK